MNLFEKIYKKSFLFEDDDEASLDEPSDSGGGDDAGGFDFDGFDADSDAGGDSGGLDSGGDFGADSLGGGGGGSDGVDVPEGDEEPEQEETEETPPPKDSLETDQEVSAIQSSVDDVIDDALMASSMAASAVMGESTIFSKIFEDEEKSNGKNLGVDIEKFASKIANLMQNYTTVLDIPNLIYQSARKRLESDYGQEWVSKFEDIIANMQLSVPIGYGSAGPVALKSVGNDVNPQNIATGNVFVTSTGGKDG